MRRERPVIPRAVPSAIGKVLFEGEEPKEEDDLEDVWG